jgi:phosphatidyl-myo-inositol dimannoside synthase
VVINLSLEPQAFEGRGSSQPESRGQTLLSVARLEAEARDKGIDEVLAVLPELAAGLPGLRYVIVGSGDDLGRLERLAAESGCADRIEFAGELDHASLLEAYSTCSVFVLPSRREGFGLVFLEAMTFGKPVVAWDAGGTTDVVVSGVTGQLVKSRDELRNALRDLLADPDRAKSMGLAGLERASTTFSFERFQEEVWEALEG